MSGSSPTQKRTTSWRSLLLGLVLGVIITLLGVIIIGMPAYGKEKISEAELADLITYLRRFGRGQG